MNRRRVKIFVVSAFVLAVVVTAGGFFLSYHDRPSAIAAAIDWARLAPLPPSAENLEVEVTGSTFTRGFVVTFEASPLVIQQWLAASPGPASATMTTAGPITTYAITPGGGAAFAEVRVDHSCGKVIIRTYWS